MTTLDLAALKEALEKASPDCGDNSCRFAVKRGGMRTNGGCRCISTRSIMKASAIERYAAIAAANIPALIQRIEELTKERDGWKSERCGYSNPAHGHLPCSVQSACGEHFIAEEQIFRCVDCGIPFCKRCLKKHCQSDLDQSRAEAERLRAALEKIAAGKTACIISTRNIRELCCVVAREALKGAAREQD